MEYDLIQIPKEKIDQKIFVEGAKWANPREIDAKKRMRKTVESYSKPREWALDLEKIIREQFNISAIFDEYDKVIGETL